MSIIGLIGGLGPESTIDYYKLIIEAWRARTGGESNPRIVVNSLDVEKMIRLVTADRRGEIVTWLREEIGRLAAAGAAFGAITANTPHFVFDQVAANSPIPLISIVEATSKAAKKMNLQRVGLLGTRFTMQGSFYPEVFTRAGIVLVRPQPDDLSLVHERYMNELLRGIFRPETKKEILGIIAKMKNSEGIEAVILAGTELPLLLRESKGDVPFLDTTAIHVQAIVDAARSTGEIMP